MFWMWYQNKIESFIIYLINLSANNGILMPESQRRSHVEKRIKQKRERKGKGSDIFLYII